MNTVPYRSIRFIIVYSVGRIVRCRHFCTFIDFTEMLSLSPGCSCTLAVGGFPTCLCLATCRFAWRSQPFFLSMLSRLYLNYWVFAQCARLCTALAVFFWLIDTWNWALRPPLIAALLILPAKLEIYRKPHEKSQFGKKSAKVYHFSYTVIQ